MMVSILHRGDYAPYFYLCVRVAPDSPAGHEMGVTVNGWKTRSTVLATLESYVDLGRKEVCLQLHRPGRDLVQVPIEALASVIRFIAEIRFADFLEKLERRNQPFEVFI